MVPEANNDDDEVDKVKSACLASFLHIWPHVAPKFAFFLLPQNANEPSQDITTLSLLSVYIFHDFSSKVLPLRAVEKFIAHFLSLGLLFLLPFNYMQFLLAFYGIPHRSVAECRV